LERFWRGCGTTGGLGIAIEDHAAGQRRATQPKHALEQRPAARPGRERLDERIELPIIHFQISLIRMLAR
jgi:hypothetical protein